LATAPTIFDLADGQAGTQNFTVDVASNFWNIDASQIPSRIRDSHLRRKWL
jgi:hypothetical protein